MILRTTRCRLDRMFDAASQLDDEESVRLAFELVSGASIAGERPTSRVEIAEMPYSAGMAMQSVMYHQCYTDTDRMRRGLSSSIHGALQDLVKATNEEARHPALRGVGMEGHHARTFHVWRIREDEWLPMPTRGAPFQILRPYWHVDDRFPSQKFTLWTPNSELPAPPSRLDDDRLHWRFA